MLELVMWGVHFFTQVLFLVISVALETRSLLRKEIFNLSETLIWVNKGYKRIGVGVYITTNDLFSY